MMSPPRSERIIDTRLKVPSVVDALYEDLRRHILTGAERQGSVLTEASLAERYQVARPTAKAAIERLVSDGLVLRARRGAGAAVRILTVSDIEDLYATRIIVESAVNVTLARRRQDVSDAERANDALHQAAEAADAPGIVAADVAFHRSLVAEHGGERLGRIHEVLMGEAHFCMAQEQQWQLLSAHVSYDEHRGILESIRAGDTALALGCTVDHLDSARERLVRHLSEANDVA